MKPLIDREKMLMIFEVLEYDLVNEVLLGRKPSEIRIDKFEIMVSSMCTYNVIECETQEYILGKIEELREKIDNGLI